MIRLGEMWWLYAYAVIGVVHSLWSYDEEDSEGMLFVDFFLWPIQVGAVALVWLWENTVTMIDVLIAIGRGEWGEDE